MFKIFAFPLAQASITQKFPEIGELGLRYRSTIRINGIETLNFIKKNDTWLFITKAIALEDIGNTFAPGSFIGIAELNFYKTVLKFQKPGG